jgi:xanthine/CO dehydrogenase XdhC/CoxF family maturation factor
VQEKSVWKRLRIYRLITAADSKGIVLVKAVEGGCGRSRAERCAAWVLVKEQGTCVRTVGDLCGEEDLRLRLKESCWSQEGDGRLSM